MKKLLRITAVCASGAMLLQFGGCLSDLLTNVFFRIGPLLL